MKVCDDEGRTSNRAQRHLSIKSTMLLSNRMRYIDVVLHKDIHVRGTLMNLLEFARDITFLMFQHKSYINPHEGYNLFNYTRLSRHSMQHGYIRR